ncbi:MAG: hypothetical protein AB1757_28105 [Acidobacteriota bacterium]
MNQPLRIAEGQMLYSDIRHIYGPFSPYLNALLFKIFSPSLNVLYTSGIITALIIIFLSYWLSRQIMSRIAALASTLAIMWLCGFKQAGNYFLPYSYGALHACALGLISLFFLVNAVKTTAPTKESEKHQSILTRRFFSNHLVWLFLAGVFAGFTLLAKTEMGIAAVATGIIAGGILNYPNLNKSLKSIACFFFPALLIISGVYGFFIAQVGWQVVSNENFIFFQHVPPELVYFNRRMSGLDKPLDSIISIIGSLLRLAFLAVAIVIVSQLITYKKDKQSASANIPLADAGQVQIIYLWGLLFLSITVIFTLSFTGIMQWDNGPYLAMPILLIGSMVIIIKGYLKEISARGFAHQHTLIVILFSGYALISLSRVILRVRSGGAYSSYLLPVSVILFTYILAYQLPGLIKNPKTRIIARNITIALILSDAILTSFLLAYRYRQKNTYPIITERGTIVAVNDLGIAFDKAIEYINRESDENDYVAVMPEGTSLNFFTRRANPLREEITTPGFLDAEGEERTIKRLAETQTKLILIANRATSEFGPIRFGRDYNQRLMQWIKDHYEESEVLGPVDNQDLQIGDPIFFLKAYRRKTSSM